MRDFCSFILALCIIVLMVGHCIMSVKVKNLEQQLKRVEQGYNEVLEANEQLERINEQNLRLMSEGGWN